MNRTNLLCAVLLSVAFAVWSHAAPAQTFEANLDGLQEVPPDASPAFGLADVMVDGLGNLTVTTGSYQDLLGGSVFVGIYDAAPGVNGPLIVTLTNDTPAANTGTFSGGGALTPSQIADMIAGNTYVNIRSQVFPSGEIRGQLLPTPEPSSMVLASLAAVGMLAVAARRRARTA